MRVVISGLTGFIGSHLLGLLRSREWDVVAVAGRQQGPIPPKLQVVPVADLSEMGGSDDAKVDAVIHLATHFVSSHVRSDVVPMIEANVQVGAQLLEYALQRDARFIYCGTAWQHVGGAEYSPDSLYAASKQAFEVIVEHYVHAKGLAAAELVLFDTYGPDDSRPKLVPLLKRAAMTGTGVHLRHPQALVDLTHVSDVCEEIMRLILMPQTDLPRHTVLRAPSTQTVEDVVATVSAVYERVIDVCFSGEITPSMMMANWDLSRFGVSKVARLNLEQGLRLDLRKSS